MKKKTTGKKRVEQEVTEGSGAVSGLGGSLALPGRQDSEYVLADRESIAVVRNVRKSFPQAELEELAASIRAVGILQPLVVRPRRRFTLLEPDLVETLLRVVDESGAVVETAGDHSSGRAMLEKLVKEQNAHGFELVAGERRLRAAGLAGLTQVPCMVRTMSDAEVRAIHRIENLQRSDITALEEAEGFREWMDEEQITADQVAERIKKSRSHVFARLKLLKLSQPVREAVLAGKVSQSIGELAARIPGEAKQLKFIEETQKLGHWAEDGQMSVRAATAHLEEKYQIALKGSKFDRAANYELLKVCPGPCTTCPKRSGNMLEEFPELKSPDICTDPAGYKDKTAAAERTREEAARAKGEEVLSKGKALFGEGWDGETFLKGKAQKEWVELKDEVPGTKGKKTWKQAVAKALPAGAVKVAFDGKGKRHELVNVDVAFAAAKEAGLKVTKPKEGEEEGSRQSNYAKERERKEAQAKAMEPVIEQALNQVRAAVRGMKTDAKFLRLLALDETISTYEVQERYKLPSNVKLREAVEAWGEPELRQWILENIFASEPWNDWNGCWSDAFKRLAAECDVDLKKLEKEAAAPAPEEKKEATKPAKGTKKKAK